MQKAAALLLSCIICGVFGTVFPEYLDSKELALWLNNTEWAPFANNFLRHDIDSQILEFLGEDDLRELIPSIGKRKKFQLFLDSQLGAVIYPIVGKNVLGSITYTYISASTKVPIVSTATGVIDANNLDKGTDTTTATRAYARNLGKPDIDDDAGHILANRLGGSGADPVNIFPQNPTLNRGKFRVFEGQIYDCIKGTSRKATLSWNFGYTDSKYPTKPTTVRYTAKFQPAAGSCTLLDQLFDN